MKSFIFTIIFIIIFVIGNVLLQNISSSYGKILVILFCCLFQLIIYKFFFPKYFKLYFSIRNIKFIWLVVGVISPLISIFIFAQTLDYYYEFDNVNFDKSNLLGKILGKLYIGITEEVFVRGVVFLFLIKRTKSILLSVIISSLIFTLMHGFGVSFITYPNSIIFFFTFGIAFATLFISSNSIWVVSIMHFLFNFLWTVLDFNTKFPCDNIYELNMVLPVIFPFFILTFGLTIYNSYLNRNAAFLNSVLLSQNESPD